MSPKETIRVPDIGDMEEVDVVEVLVAAGDTLGVEDPLITLESDKASMDVPSPKAGVVAEVAVSVGDKVAEGDAILVLEVEEEAPEEEAPEEEAPGQEAPEEESSGEERADEESSGESAEDEQGETETEDEGAEEEVADEPGDETAARDAASSPRSRRTTPPSPRAGRPTLPAIDEETFARAYAGPAVRRFARQLGVDLGRVEGTGRNGRILEEDVQEFVKRVLSEAAAGGPSAGSLPGIEIPEMPAIDFSKFGEIERRPLSRIQKISGPSLHRSWLHVPHVTQHDEADITDLEAFRQENKAKAKEQGFSLTPLAFIMKGVVSALDEFPAVNATLDTESAELILKKYYNLGVAVDTPDGLVVPVIKEVDCKGIFDLARELAEVSSAAREGKLKLDQLQGASFTITSLGGIGGTAFTPIVNAPEVGILGVSRSYRKPVWRDDGEGGGSFVPRLMLPLSFSYDHRAVDGATAVRFTTFLAQELSDIRKLLL